MNDQEFKEFVFSQSRNFSLGKVTSGLTHELNNPLAVITGHVDMLNLMLEMGKLEESKLESSLVKIEEAAYGLAHIIKKVWEFSSSQRSEKVVLSTHDVFKNIEVFFEKKFESNNIEFTHEFDINHLFMAVEKDISLVFLNFFFLCQEAVIKQKKKIISASSKLVGREIEINFTVHQARISPEFFDKDSDLLYQSTVYYLERDKFFHRILGDENSSTFQIYVPSH